MTETPQDPPPFPPADDNPLAAPLSIADILDGAFRLYRANLGPLLLSAVAVLAPLGILSALAVGPSQGAQWSQIRAAFTGQSALDPAALSGGSMLASVAACCLLPLQFLALFLARLILVQQAVDAFNGRARRLGERVSEALRRLPGYAALGCMVWFLIAVVVGTLGLAGAVAIGVAMAAVGTLGGGSTAGVVAAILFIVGVVGLIAVVSGAALYLAGRWVAALPSLILRQPQPVAALDDSWQLTRRRPWRSMGFVALLTLLIYVLDLIIGTPLVFAFVVLPPSATTVLGILFQAMSAVVQIIMLPLWASAVVIYHYDLRLRADRAL